MKKSFFILIAALCMQPLWAAEQCVPHETTVIDSEAHCVANGGIDIGSTEEDGLKVACMQAQKVKSLCGEDGQITRLHAYTQWFNKLQHFEDQCASQGGTFSYQDPSFVEPQNESYCLQATPEVSTSMFEEPLCNYRSVCPAVTVVCERPCERTVAQTF